MRVAIQLLDKINLPNGKVRRIYKLRRVEEEPMDPQEIYAKTMSGVPRRPVTPTAVAKRDDDDNERPVGRLKNLRIGELSLVDHPANQHARVTLTKQETPMGFDLFGDAVAAIATRERVPMTKAMQKARRLYPDLFDKLQINPQHESRPVLDRRTVAQGVLDFDRLVDEIAVRDRIPRHAAMRVARREHPTEFAAYQDA